MNEAALKKEALWIMDNSTNKLNTSAAASNQKNRLALSFLALGLSLLPFFLLFISSLGVILSGFFLTIMLLSPIVGIIVGVAALAQPASPLGVLGKVLAIIAIAIPLCLIFFILIIFIGAVTGLISFM